MENRMLTFFKTFSDINRIRIAALLSQKRMPLEQIALKLELKPIEVERHLTRFEKMGMLIKERDEYSFDVKALEALTRDLLADERPVVLAASNDENADDFDRNVIKNYTQPDGRLKEIPLQEKKLRAVLNHVLQVFKPGLRYSEKEINQQLARFHEDTAYLRRALVDRRMLNRERNGTAYWR